jgi:S-adenosyl methyltransferase
VADGSSAERTPLTQRAAEATEEDDNTHDVAQRAAPESKIVYVDDLTRPVAVLLIAVLTRPHHGRRMPRKRPVQSTAKPATASPVRTCGSPTMPASDRSSPPGSVITRPVSPAAGAGTN